MSVVRAVRVLVSLAFVACVSWPGVTAASDTGHGVIASFEGGWINLAALAWLLPFWSFLLAVGLGCFLGFIAFLLLSRQGN